MQLLCVAAGFCFPYGGLQYIDMEEHLQAQAGKRVTGAGLEEQVDAAMSGASSVAYPWEKIKEASKGAGAFATAPLV